MKTRFAVALLFAVALFPQIILAQETPLTPPARVRDAKAAPRTQRPPFAPTAEELAGIQTKLAEFRAAIAALKDSKADDDLIVDAESCGWIVENIVRVPGGFLDQSFVNRCTALLSDGLRRAEQIKAGTAEWPKLAGRVNRGYRSAVDGTAQPYRLSIPTTYDAAKPIPLYVYLHGRSQSNPDLGMGWAGGNDRAQTGRGGNANYIRLEPFGRGNNSFRWAGEADVLEAIASVRKRYNIDPDRILLAGFSMGGAGAWQIGLHNPDMFCGLEIDAGVIGSRFNTEGMSPVQRAAQTTYGLMIGHALNTFNVPLVGYAGENDAQLQASTNVREQLVREGYTVDQTSKYVGKGKDINALFLVDPGKGHSHATGETLKLINEFNAENLSRGRTVPDHIKFVTYTTRYNRSFWITVDGLERHFERATVEAQRNAEKTNVTLKTANVSRLKVSDAASLQSISIDGDSLVLETLPANSPQTGANSNGAPEILLTRNSGHWQVAKQPDGNATPDGSTLRKQHNLQGPLNDAFLDAFVCVAPSGTPYSTLAAGRAKQELDRFTNMFARDYCGEAKTKPDSAITPEDIANCNLILFGDPGSNKLIAQIAEKLPIKWTRDTIIVGTKTYPTAEHAPVLIYPNPLNPSRYVVINSGLTPGGRGDSSYGDYAVLKLREDSPNSIATEVVEGGTFGETWELILKP